MSVYQDAVKAMSALADTPKLERQADKLSKKKASASKQSTSSKNGIKRLVASEKNAYEQAANLFLSLIDKTHGEVVVTFRVD